jgi:type I restriction enzyme M protein
MRYERMLKGLEAVEGHFSAIESSGRLDAESLRKSDLHNANQLSRVTKLESIDSLTFVSDGNHLSIASEFGSDDSNGVRYLRGQDINGEMVLDDRNPVFIPDSEYEKLTRSHIFTNDVLVTIVGANTGQTALVDVAPDKLTANCKLGILRPKASFNNPAYLHAFLSGRYGQAQIASAKRGGAQTGLILPDLKSLKVPRFSPRFEDAVSNVSSAAHKLRRAALVHLDGADEVLMRFMGMDDWEPPNPANYVRNSRDVFLTERLDAQYFQERYAALSAFINRTGAGKKLGDQLCKNQRGKQPQYSESGLPVINSKHVIRNEVRLDADNRLASFSAEDLLICNGDVLLNGTGVGTIGRASAYLHATCAIPDNHVTLLRPAADLDPVYLSVFLNSKAGQYQVEQRLRGSSGQIELYPSDIAQFDVWLAPMAIQKEIRTLVENSFRDRQEAIRKLGVARRAVELAIENSEAEALAYLQQE